MSIDIQQGDCRELLKKLPDESVHCVVTSPPYWGLRDYGITGQLGLEDSLFEHVDIMVDVFKEVRRVLRKDGTLWLNYGDCYVTSPPGNKPNTTALSSGLPNSIANQEMRRAGQAKVNKAKSDGLYDRKMGLQIGHGEDKEKIWGTKKQYRAGRSGGNSILKSKDLCGVPWRIALALQEDGWWLRQDIVWFKPNPMPESTTDRCTKSHEYIFLMTKAPHYYCDMDAIREGVTGTAHRRMAIGATNGTVSPKSRHNDKRIRANPSFHAATGDLVSSRNKRSVWEVPVEPFPGAHFATFPTALITPCIQAGCPQGGTVLDPFAGAGTVGVVANRLQCNAILMELNPDYVKIAKQRIKKDGSLFANHTYEPKQTPKRPQFFE